MQSIETPIPWAEVKMGNLRNPRRNKEQIMADVLKTSLEPIFPTHLMYQTNLSWRALADVLSYLTERGLIKRVEFTPNKRTKEVVVCTDEGKLFLEAWNEVQKYRI